MTYGFGLSGRGFKVERIFPARMKALCILAPTAADGPIQPPETRRILGRGPVAGPCGFIPPSTNREPRTSKMEHKPLRANDLRRRFPDRPPSYPQAIPTGSRSRLPHLLIDLFLECRIGDAKQFRGLRPVAAGRLERAHNHLAFHLLERAHAGARFAGRRAQSNLER